MIHYHCSQTALSKNQEEKLLKKISSSHSQIVNLHSQYIHYAEFIDEPSLDDIKTLENLLIYGEPRESGSTSKHKFIIIPRFGTLSPWASKATDIAKRCGLKITKIERGLLINLISEKDLVQKEIEEISRNCFDRMTETIIYDQIDGHKLFIQEDPKPLQSVDILNNGINILHDYNIKNGLALSEDEVQYLYQNFLKINKNPTDAELMMFAQANSEHCRHKIFNASWNMDGKDQEKSLFQMIRNTHNKNPKKTIVAYSDNSSIIEGKKINRFYPGRDNKFKPHSEKTHYLMKVETHNHPTAISPFPGAATGSGGEIRDEGATGRGSKPKAGLTGFSVSNLNIPNYSLPWETAPEKPDHISSPLDIMIDGPIGGASYNNEFGRPNIAGYFRVFEQKVDGKKYGYHKPIMLAGGVGNISDNHTHKKLLDENVLLIQLGGPGMLIGLGGGAASSMDSGSNDESLDYASVQRGNPEIQRRAQEVIDRCWQLQEDNPILSIHDVGAGGLSNAFPELINDGEVGAEFDIRNIDTEEKGMAPHELWCNESQERYVLAINQQSLDLFKKICDRERCPFRVIGKAKKNRHIHVKDNLLNQDVVNMDLDVLLGKPPKLLKKIPKKIEKDIPKSSKINDKDLYKKVISHPSVASKKFLITIGDRSVTGLIAQDQMVGPWQTPVSNVAVTKFSFEDVTGEAFAIGERTPLAISNAKKSARMAVAEAITNIVAANIGNITNVKLSANWMAASGDDDEDNNLFAAVHAVGEELCPQLGISIPVGKDSMSMTTKWNDRVVTSPLSLIVTAFSECENIQKTCTPEFIRQDDYIFLYIDLGMNQYRIGGSIAEQVNNTMSSECPDIDDPKILVGFCDVIQQLINQNLIYAYHDRSDGGLFATLSEMAFASRCGIDIDLSQINAEYPNILFSEELGAVIQVDKKNEEEIINLFREKNIKYIFNIGKINHLNQINIKHGSDFILEQRSELEKIWSLNSYHIQSIRDNAKLAAQELSLVDDNNDPGIRSDIKFKLKFTSIAGTKKPQIAILREQGVNGHYEMAAAFYYAGFDTIDVHMQDLMDGNYTITDFRAFVACGGFSYGDVLGAGEGWSKVILNNPMLRDQFTSFFNQSNSIALGVCNGCQMMSNLKSIIPGADKWPKFVKNLSDQFESRVVTVKIPKNNSIFFNEMENSSIPVITAHGEGRAFFSNPNDHKEMSQKEQITLQYVTNLNEVTTHYPLNPNGSVDGVTGFTNDDGRFNIMMPHPERVFRSDQNTWSRDKNSGYGPWFKMFTNAYYYLKNS